MSGEITLLHSSAISEELANKCDVAAFVKLFSTYPPQTLIKNISSDFYYLQWEGHAFPVTVTNQYNTNNSYVASIYNTYIRYALQELTIAKLSLVTRIIFTILIKLIALILKPSKLDRVVYINNWLLSTNLYPAEFTPNHTNILVKFLTPKFKQHAICLRSLNYRTNKKLITTLSENNFSLIGSRQVYIFDARQGDQSPYLKRRDNKNDQEIRLKSQSYLEDINTTLYTDYYQQIEYHYNQLYIDKYSLLNPQFTAKLIEKSEGIGILETNSIHSKEGKMIGVLGLFSRYNIMTSPIVGYQASALRENQTYRQIMSYNLEQAKNQTCLFNASSGISEFKYNRGAEPEIEYSAIYTQHLPFVERIRWKFLQLVVNKIALPFMKKQKL